MSDYKRVKVLRIPFEDLGIGSIDEYDDIFCDLEKKYGDMFSWYGSEVGKFQISPTSRPFIDFVLDIEYPATTGEYGKVRYLYLEEVKKYKPLFEKLSPTINMNKVKVVEYCWYNCCEAPDYYACEDDDFYREIPFICKFT